MRIRFLFAFLVSMFLLADAWGGNPRDRAIKYVAGSETDAEMLIVANTIQRILAITSDPATLHELLTRDLRRSGCFKLPNGASRCIYSDPTRGEGHPLPLVDLDLIGLHRPGDLGGTAFWDAREGICVSPHAFDTLGNPQIESGSLPGEPFAPGETVELTEYIFQDVNPNWGRVDLKLRVRHGCARSIQLRMARPVD